MLTLPVMHGIGGTIPISQARKLRLRGPVNLPVSEGEALAVLLPTLKSDMKHCILSTQKLKETQNKPSISFTLEHIFKFGLLFLPKLPFLGPKHLQLFQLNYM